MLFMFMAGWHHYCHFILKEYYKDEPLFSDSKIVTSIYNQSFDDTLNKDMHNKIKFDNIDENAINIS